MTGEGQGAGGGNAAVSSSSRPEQGGGPRLFAFLSLTHGAPGSGEGVKAESSAERAAGDAGGLPGTLNVVRSGGVTDLYFSERTDGLEGILEKPSGKALCHWQKSPRGRKGAQNRSKEPAPGSFKLMLKAQGPLPAQLPWHELQALSQPVAVGKHPSVLRW